MQSEFLISVLLANVVLLLTAAATYQLYRMRSAAMAERSHSEVVIQSMRRDLEEQVYRLNTELQSSDLRWQNMNHLLQEFQDKSSDQGLLNNSRNSSAEFLASLSIDPDVTIDSKLVFVLMPFHDRYDDIFQIIKEQAETAGLRVERGDEFSAGGNILSSIVRKVLQARIVIPLLDGRNPNVLYELGIAHALGRKTLLLAQSPRDTIFDLKMNRTFFYESRYMLEKKLGAQLLSVITNEE